MVAWEESLEGWAPNPSPHGHPPRLSPLWAQLNWGCPSNCRHHHRHHWALAQARKAGPATPAPHAAPARRMLSVSPRPAQSARRPTRRCLRLLSRDRHHFRIQHRPSHRSRLCGGAPLTPAPGDLGRDLRWAAGRACAQDERARAREAARCGLLLPQPRSCCTRCCLLALPEPAEKLVTSSAGGVIDSPP